MTGLVRTPEHGPGLDPARIAETTGGEWLRDPAPTTPIMGASIDTRNTRPGNLFFAIPGERVDGHSFLGAAASAGAGVAVVERAVDLGEFSAAEPGMGVLRVRSSRDAMTALAWAYREDLRDVRVVGVTGSNGKTTTVRLIDAACRGGGLVGSHAQKSQNNELGVPLTMLNARPTDDTLICEVGTNAPGEIGTLAALIRPDIAVITSIGRAHIERLGSVAGIAREKAALVRCVAGDGLAVVTSDSPELDAELDRARTDGGLCRVIRAGVVRTGTAGPESGVDVCAAEYRAADGGSAFTVNGRRVLLPLPGAHNAGNSAIAVAVAIELGVALGDACDGLSRTVPPEMRLEVIDTELDGETIRIINDAYNANPESMRAGLALLARGELDPRGPRPRRVAVLGDMFEMGDASHDAHREIASLAMADDGIDSAFFIGSAFDDALGRGSGGGPPGLFGTDDAWTDEIVSQLEPGDVVLLKGSRGMRLERLVDAVRARASSSPTR